MKKNILFALAVILLAGVIAVTRVMTRTEGTTARVEITDAETITLPLDKDGTYEISEGKLRDAGGVWRAASALSTAGARTISTARATAGFQKRARPGRLYARGRCGIGGKRRLTAILRAAGEMYSFCKVGKRIAHGPATQYNCIVAVKKLSKFREDHGRVWKARWETGGHV